MQILGFILSLLLNVRAHIPNQPGFGSGPVDTSYSTPFIRGVAAFLITQPLSRHCGSPCDLS